MNKSIYLLTALSLLTGCGVDEKINSKSFYIENETARTEKLKYCDEYPNKQSEPNCINAHEARTQITSNQMKNNGIVVDYSSLEK